MISTNDFRTGLTIELDGQIYTVIDFMHVKPGKGSAFVRSKLRNIETGSIVEKTFRAGEKVKKAHLDKRKMQYLYSDGEFYYFMDQENFEQISLTAEQLEGGTKYIKENMVIDILFHNEKNVGVEIPNSVELKVTDTEPGIKGDTAAGGTKEATLETGLTVQVPLFIETDDIIRIDTRSGEYMERVSQSS